MDWMPQGTLPALAALVQRGDPDRFMAAMAAPPPTRAALFTLAAANLEIARAPWASKDPLIARMRLQFWRDCVADPAHAPTHEVATPLARLILARDLPRALFDRLITAREADLDRTPFATDADLWHYLCETSGLLAALTIRALGEPADEAARDWGAAQGLANYLRAVPALEAAGRLPLPDGRAPTIAALAREGLARQARARATLPRAARPALLAAWQSATILKRAARDPASVAEGRLETSEFTRRLTLIKATLFGP
jgi:phytoene/squalene synthetase